MLTSDNIIAILAVMLIEFTRFMFLCFARIVQLSIKEEIIYQNYVIINFNELI